MARTGPTRLQSCSELGLEPGAPWWHNAASAVSPPLFCQLGTKSRACPGQTDLHICFWDVSCCLLKHYCSSYYQKPELRGTRQNTFTEAFFTLTIWRRIKAQRSEQNYFPGSHRANGKARIWTSKPAMLDPWGNLSGRHSLYDSPHNTHTFGVLIWDRRTSGVERSCAPCSGFSV